MGTFRFFLALNVMIFHLVQVPKIGPYAVYSFFILSGFLMTTIMHKTYGYGLEGFKKYAVNRFLRIFPIYWIFIALTVIVIFFVSNDFVNSYNSAFGLPNTNASWLANLTLVYPSFEPISYTPRLSPSSWALTIELFFYCLIGLGFSRNLKITLIWFSCSIMYWLYGHATEASFLGDYGDIFSASLPFSIGALLFYLNKKAFEFIQTRIKTIVIVLSALFIVNLFSAILIKTYLAQVFFLYINMLLSVLLVAALAKVRLQGILKSIDNFLGDLSYPIYIFHWTAGAFSSWLLFSAPVRGFSFQGFLVLGLAFCITIGISTLLNACVNDSINKVREVMKKK